MQVEPCSGTILPHTEKIVEVCGFSLLFSSDRDKKKKATLKLNFISQTRSFRFTADITSDDGVES